MDTILQDLIGALADATDCKGMGYVLKNIRQHLLETDSTGWDYVVDEVISRINEIAKLKREKYIEGPNHKPYYIASGKEVIMTDLGLSGSEFEKFINIIPPIIDDISQLNVKEIKRTIRAPRAIREIKIFLTKHMKAEDVKIDESINHAIWKRGIQKIPSKITVKAVKDDDGIVTATLAE